MRTRKMDPPPLSGASLRKFFEASEEVAVEQLEASESAKRNAEHG